MALNVSESDLLSVATSLALQATPIQTVAGNWKEVRVDRSATCGAAVRFCCNLDLQPATSNWVERIDHIGIASADTANEEAFFHNHLGCRIESRQTDYETQLAVENFVSDRYGIVQHQRAPQQVGGLRVLFLNVGDCELEVLSELDSNPPRLIDRHDSGNTRQDRSAIGRFVERRGPGLHHVALKVPDINGLLKHLNRRKYRLIDPVGRPGSRRALIGFVHPAELGGVLIHFVERDDV
jgi:methylmalonyl-CoA/ethylmalonyl-CoA epimerase